METVGVTKQEQADEIFVGDPPQFETKVGRPVDAVFIA